MPDTRQPTIPPALHADEIPITETLVHDLLRDQFPRYASLPLHRLPATGSTNVLYRLGPDLLVRLPRQPAGGRAIEKERRWSSHLRSRLPAAIPEILAIGAPTRVYGEHWSIVRWLPGQRVTAFDPLTSLRTESASLALDLAAFIRSLQAAEVPSQALADRSLRGYRGGALSAFDSEMQRTLQRCRALGELDLDLDHASTVWAQALTLPGAQGESTPRWYHGDLVAENLLQADGRLTAVLDFGGLGIGDPTVELHGVWEVLDGEGRALLRTSLGVDEPAWLRGRAWALAIALSTLSYYWHSLPGRREDRLAMARSVLADAA